ncbi:unnamed protein product [Cylicocyclus nassatus]|uniref:Uncharacterized protein n=1 Tax=Cylicocyclus nassatus TaxID=53992 RepID=A0AA36M8E2_CYLNA|nr:unnamed protein product [Cylicocyclus nassatus]
MAGNYLVKNSNFGMKFLNEWANSEFHLPYSFHGNDQGPLMMLLLKLLVPGSSVEYSACEKYWKKATDVNTYLAMVYCVRQALGVTKIWPDKVRIFRKFHAFARDDFTNGRWCDADFMFHGWKRVERNQIFEENIDLNLCDQGMKAWKWKNKNISVQELRYAIQIAEKFFRAAFPKEAEIHPFLDNFNISHCYPDCDKFDLHL